MAVIRTIGVYLDRIRVQERWKLLQHSENDYEQSSALLNLKNVKAF